MAERDWNRFGEYLDGMGDPIPWARDACLVCVGIAVTGVVAVLAWLGELAQLKEGPSLVFIAAGVVLLSMTLAAIGIAVVSFLMNRDVKKKMHRDAAFLHHDMDEVHPFDQGEGSRTNPPPTPSIPVDWIA
jgi:hypothetical protein